MNKKVVTLALVVFLLLFLISSSVLAGYASQQNVIEGVTVIAEKGLNVGSDRFTAWVWSKAASPIGTIGWTWWTVREYCPDLYWYPVNYQYSGYAEYNSNGAFSASGHIVNNCSGTRKEFQNLGTHDFKQGSTVWRPMVNLVDYQ